MYLLRTTVGPFSDDFMNLLYLLSLASVWALAIQPLHGEAAMVVSLASVGDRVRAQNPQLAAARLMIREALGRELQAGRLPNPELETEIEQATNFGEHRVEIGLSQRFPVTGRLKLEKKLGATELKAAEAEVREVANQLIGDARVALVEVLAIRERKRLLEEQVALAKELADFVSDLVKRGEDSVLQAGQARLEAARLMTESRQLSAAEARAVGVLKPLLGMRPGEALHVSGKLPGADSAVANSRQNRPALELAQTAIEAAAQETAIERAKCYGDVEAGIFAAAERKIDAPDGAEKEGIIGLRFKLPLPWWDRNEGNINAAVAKTERRKMEASALSQSIQLEAEAARTEMKEWASLVGELDSELLPQAAEQVALAEQAWRDGQGELLTVLRGREQRLELAAARLDALRDFQLARVRYQTVLGNP